MLNRPNCISKPISYAAAANRWRVLHRLLARHTSPVPAAWFHGSARPDAYSVIRDTVSTGLCSMRPTSASGCSTSAAAATSARPRS